jgi:hypothetical protein
MNTPTESEEFQQVRRLLALKRHEQPPSGYFNGFSRQVILRIQSGEARQRVSWLERLQSEVPWLQRLWSALDAKPMLAGAFGVTVCGLLVGGLVYSYQVEPASGDPLVEAPADPSAVFVANRSLNPRPAGLPVELIASTGVSNAMLTEARTSLFEQTRPITPRANFSVTPDF